MASSNKGAMPHSSLAYMNSLLDDGIAESYLRFSDPPFFAQRRCHLKDSTPHFHVEQQGYDSTNPGDSRNIITTNTQGKRVELQFTTGLLQAESRPPGAYMNGEVIIMAITNTRNQGFNVVRRVKEMNNNIQHRRPVGIIVQKNALKSSSASEPPVFPCNDMETDIKAWHLGFFLPTHIWPWKVKMDNGTVGTIWTVRFEKPDLTQRSWFSNKASSHIPIPPLDQRDYTTKAQVHTCSTCGQDSPQILAAIITCLKDDCPQCWKDSNGKLIERRHRNDLLYSTKFLQERYDRLDPALAPVALEPYYPNILPDFDDVRENTFSKYANDDYASTPTRESVARLNQRCGGLITGFGCPNCGMTNSRVKWEAFHCRKSSCGFYSLTAPPSLTPEYMMQVNEAIAQRQNETRFAYEQLIGFQRKRNLGDFSAFEYRLANGCYLAILKPRKDSGALSTSNEIFTQLLAAANDGSLGLERRGMQTAGGRAYTRHLSANFGELYPWGAAVPTTKYKDAPEVISLGHKTLNEICKPYLDGEIGEGADEVGEPGKNDFNQMYIPAYLGTNMSIGLHDDGEKGLGHFIATYTIGGYGRFTIAVKPKPNYGRDMTARGKSKPSGKWLEDDPLIPGCTRYAERRGLWRRYGKGIISKRQWKAEFQDLMEAESGGDRKLMQFPVRHGDIVLMYGSKTQQTLNHALTNESPIRFALTGRRVVGEMATAKQIKVIDDWIQADKEYVPAGPGSTMKGKARGQGAMKRARSKAVGQDASKKRKMT